MKKLVCLLFCLLLIGCTDPIQTGTIYQKKHNPAHSKQEQYVITYIEGTPVHGWRTVHVPDKYWISFKEPNEETGRFDTRTVQISKEVYEKHEIGDHFEWP